MPKGGISTYFTIEDGGSLTLSRLADKTRALDKETQQLEQSYKALQKANEPLIKRQAELEKKLEAAKKEAKEAQKAFKKLGDEASGDAYEKAKQHQEELRAELSKTNGALKENEAIFRQNMEMVRKSSTGSSWGGNSGTNLAVGLISGQVGDMLSSSLGGAIESLVTSGLGVPAASLLTNAASDAISGAVAGSVFGPLGMLIGGLGGAASGLISGGTEIYAAKDDAFKEYYAGLYEDVNADTEEMISSGSTIAGSREQTHKAFAKRLGGEEEAEEYLDQVQTMAARTNYGYDEITGYSQQLLNTYNPEEVFSVLQSLSDASAGLKLSSSDVEVMISGLSRMRTTGKATQEYLNYFSERGVDVYTALGEALGVDKSQIAGMVTKGDIKGEVAAEAILDFIDKEFGGLSKDLMSTYDAKTANLEDIMATLDAAGGAGYNEMRKSGLDAETEAYSGALGEAVEEINRIAGENKAYLENLSEQYKREALSAVLLGEETTVYQGENLEKLEALREAYAAASALYDETKDRDAALEMERLKESAEALATAAYESSDEYQTYMDNQLEQIAEIRDNTASMAAALNEYRLNQATSKGEAATWDFGPGVDKEFSSNPDNFNYFDVAPTGSGIEGRDGWYDDGGNWHSFAFGLDRVPYDEYPALLHEDERVLTASEAREADAGGGKVIIQISVTGNDFVGTGEEMADQLMEVVVPKIEAALVTAIPK